MSRELEAPRARRIALWSVGATTLVLTASLLGPSGKELAMPGELRSVHAPLSQECERCHSTGGSAIRSIFSDHAESELGHRQDAKCVVCHENWTAPESAHGIEDYGPSGHFHCARCHHEHQGRDSNLLEVADASCQTCHQESFASFEHGHPEIDSWSSNIFGRIQFDHHRHATQHFPSSDVTGFESCSACHVVASDGAAMETLSFAESCAVCHEEEIRGSKQVDGAGLVVFGLPALDVLSLEDAGIELGTWPADSEFGEAPLAPIMASLMVAEMEESSWRAPLRGLDLLDLQDATEDELRAVEDVAWRIKRFTADLMREGQAGLVRRLRALTKEDLASEMEADLCASLSSELVSEAVLSWFPNLNDELAARAAEEPIDGPAFFEGEVDLALEGELEAWVDRGGWYRQNLDWSIRYRPEGHADPFLRAWIELAFSPHTQLDESEQDALQEHLFSSGTAGVCAKCHVAPEPGRPFLWESLGSEPETTLTRFRHETHFPMLAGGVAQGCSECHQLEPQGFQPHQRATCLDCHGETAASAKCTTCHQYHAGPVRDRSLRWSK